MSDARARVERAVETVRQENNEAGNGGKPGGGDLRPSDVIARALSFGYGAGRRRRGA